MALKKEDLWNVFVRNRKDILRERLILEHISLVKYVVARVAPSLPSYVEDDDLINSGIMGLIHAVDHFDPSRGVQFETYAMPKIRGAILDGLRVMDWAPRSVRKKARLLEQTVAQLEHTLGRSATDEEIAEGLHMDVADYYDLLEDVHPLFLLPMKKGTISEEGDILSLEELMEDSDSLDPSAALEREETRQRLTEALCQLPERERLVVILYYYEELSFKEIALVLGVTPSRVSQIHTSALVRLRARMAMVPV